MTVTGNEFDYDKDASFYTNTYLDAKGRAGGAYYSRDATNLLFADTDSAVNLGTLTYNRTQLDVTASLSMENPANYYEFELDGDELKLSIYNYTGTSDLRAQIIDSNGKVIADNSHYADEDLATAMSAATSEDGLSLEAGTYYVKMTVDVGEKKSVDQAYVLSLYSGTVFREVYSTIAASQIKSSQHVEVDNTMVFSTLDAVSYSTKDTHTANETVDTAINIGWVYENKTALEVKSILTSASTEHYYSLTLQKGENLKFALDETTEENTLRVQIMDPSGTYVYADSEGTEKQKAAYESLLSENGLDVKNGQYLIKVSLIQGIDKSEDMQYSFKVYSGTSFDTLYQTAVGSETMKTALLNGSYTSQYSQVATLASYLEADSTGETPSIIDALTMSI